MSIAYTFEDSVVLITGATGALGSATVEAFLEGGATVAAADVVPPDADDSLLAIDHDRLSTHVADFTEEDAVERVVSDVIDDHGRLDALVSVAGTWRGGTPIEETDVETFELLFAVNLRTAFLSAKHTLPHLRETSGSIVTVSARSSLEGGSGDGPYRASKAGVRLLTDSIAAENEGSVRANSIMPNVIDTPANREAMPDADHDSWTDPADIADVIKFLCSDGADPISGAAIPV
ncbi:MAG: SDR family oxidoreductase [archaeon]